MGGFCWSYFCWALGGVSSTAPSAIQQLDLGRLQWIALVRHLCFAIDGSDQFDHQTLIRLMRNDRRFFATTGEKPVELRHLVLALGLGRLMTTVTIGLQDGADLPVETDLVCLLFRFDMIVGNRRNRHHQQQAREQR